MKRGRWVAVAMCTVVVGAATGLLYLTLYGGFEQSSIFRYIPYVALLLFVASPAIAAWLSDSPVPFAAATGGIALGIGTTVLTAALRQGGTGAMPITLGVAVGGIIGLRGTQPQIWARIAALVVLAAYALLSQRFVSVVFVYPLLGMADEFADVFDAWRARSAGPDEPAGPDERVTTGRS